MEKWELYTRGGEYVATVRTPAFRPPADVLMWGQRFFGYDPTLPGYSEVVCFYVPPDQEVPR